MSVRLACAFAPAFALLLGIGCEPEPAVEPPAPPRWVYLPRPPTLPLGPVRGHIGRGQAPQLSPPVGITGQFAGNGRAPMRGAKTWQVPGDGPARAVVAGTADGETGIELVDIDAGAILWRDTVVCAGGGMTVQGVTERAVVCADPQATRAIALDGKPAWQSNDVFIAMTDDHVVFQTNAADKLVATVRDADTGSELSTITLPAAVVPTSILASCGDAGRELFAKTVDGKLQRVIDTAGVAKLAWAMPVGSVQALDACGGETILATLAGKTPDTMSLVAIARATGKVVGRVDGVRAWWPGRDDADHVEIVTADAVTRWTRDLTASTLLDVPVTRELLASRGDRRLVRLTDHTAAILDKTGVRAHLAMSSSTAALGDRAIIASTTLGPPDETVHRIAIPTGRWRGELRASAPGREHGVMVPAELRAIPDAAPLGPAVITRDDAAKHRVSLAHAVGEQLYVVPVEREPDDTNGGGLARMDLLERGVRWLRPDGCGPGSPVAMTIARDVVVCAAQVGALRARQQHLAQPAMVRATTLDGRPSWDLHATNVDALIASADIVGVHDADRLTIVDASDGRAIGAITSDDGDVVRAALVEVDHTAWLVSFERGRLVARVPRAALTAVWSLDVDGVVARISPSDGAVLVELDDGDAYRIEPRTAQITALPGVGLAWLASHELVMGSTPGGPLYAPPPPPKPGPVKPVVIAKPVWPPPTFTPPPFSVPIPTPPIAATSWQLTLFDGSGAFRTRHDYALASPVVPAQRGAPSSPVVVGVGTATGSDLVVIDVATGTPTRHVTTPDSGLAFSTIVDGKPVAGIVLPAPLRVVLF